MNQKYYIHASCHFFRILNPLFTCVVNVGVFQGSPPERRVKDFEETEPRSNWAYLQNGAQIFAIVVKGVTVDVRNPANQMVWEFNMVLHSVN